jgi:hypothetical protein
VGTVLVFVVVAAVAGVVLYLQWQREQKRRSLLVEWAAANNWTYLAEDDQWCSRWQGTPFGDGDHRRARNVLTGAWKGKPFVSFDYSYQTHSSNGKGGQSTQTHHCAVSAVQLPTYLPRLQVTPENLLTRFGNAVGLSDIELESEDFNRAFRVHANDPKFASDVLSARTMALLLSRPHLSWRIEGTDILCWQDGEQKPVAVTAAVATMLDVVAGIPSFVWHDHGYDAGSTTVGGTS